VLLLSKCRILIIKSLIVHSIFHIFFKFIWLFWIFVIFNDGIFHEILTSRSHATQIEIVHTCLHFIDIRRFLSILFMSNFFFNLFLHLFFVVGLQKFLKIHILISLIPISAWIFRNVAHEFFWSRKWLKLKRAFHNITSRIRNLLGVGVPLNILVRDEHLPTILLCGYFVNGNL